MPGKHDQKTHASRASTAAGNWYFNGRLGDLDKTVFNLKGARTAKGLPKGLATKLDEVIKESSSLLRDLRKVSSPAIRQAIEDKGHRSQSLIRRVDRVLENYNDWMGGFD